MIYINELEKQNEELRHLLAEAEKRAIDRDMAWRVLYAVLRNCDCMTQYQIKKGEEHSVVINLSGNITIADLPENEFIALKHVLDDFNETKQCVLNNSLAKAFACYAKL